MAIKGVEMAHIQDRERGEGEGRSGNNRTLPCTATMPSATSVFKSSSVWFFDLEVGNHGPQLVQTIAHPLRTATELNRTGPIQFSCPIRPVSTTSFIVNTLYYRLLTNQLH
jgi:hypothetical protein